MSIKRRYSAIAILCLTALVGFGFAASQALARGAAPAPARQTSATNVIRVTASGDVSVPPDQATLNLGVDTKASTAQEALANNADKMTAVIAAIEAKGVPAAQIQTTGLSIYFDPQSGLYSASHQLTVTIDNISKVGAILDASVAAGANNSWGVNFGLKNPTVAQAEALKAAVANGRIHADALASALQVTITGVRSASEPTYSSRPIVYGAASGAPVASAPTPVQPGQLTVTAQVDLVYTF